MNFWEAQAKARSKTKIYLAVFVIITILVAIVAEWAMRYFSGDAYNPPLPFIGLGFIAITFCVAAFNYSMYGKYGGSYVAESIGAYKVEPTTTHPKERMLLNVVEEISVASALPMPNVYIIPAVQINAFAAGLTSDNAAVAISEGALYQLNREEIQGVIAHEFGHIYNGDMKISMRLAAMVMGFFFVLYLGFRLLQIAGFRRSSSDNGRGGGNPIALAALIFMAAGVITWFAGSVLKATVSRQREYLADACAVQFTRNPNGIANALRKIAKGTVEDMPKEGSAFSHMYIDEHGGWSALFATHPPLQKRIEAIEGKTYMPEEWREQLASTSTPQVIQEQNS